MKQKLDDVEVRRAYRWERLSHQALAKRFKTTVKEIIASLKRSSSWGNL